MTPKPAKKRRKAAVPTHALPPGRRDDRSLTVVLYIPAYILSPNGRCAHWRARNAAVKRAKSIARLFTLKVLDGAQPPAPVAYSLAYYWPSTHRDDDNAIASAKSYLDGICSALGVDDRHLRFRELSHHADRGCPRLEITMHLAAE